MYFYELNENIVTHFRMLLKTLFEKNGLFYQEMGAGAFLIRHPANLQVVQNPSFSIEIRQHSTINTSLDCNIFYNMLRL